MPRIDRKILKFRPKVPVIKFVNNDSPLYYNSSYWRDLRSYKICKDPLCEECLKHGRIVPAADGHHLIPWETGATAAEKWDLLLDESNVRMLCEKCHYGYHTKMRKNKLKSCDGLTDDEYNHLHGLI